MLVYIIDGYNLIHQVPALKKSDTPQRDLVAYIQKNRLTGSRNNKLIIVFDGNLDLELKANCRGFCELVGSGPEQSADELIKNRVKAAKSRSEVVVVTNDREIISAIRKSGARSLPVSGFIKKKKAEPKPEAKDISYSLQHEITEEMRKIWLKDQP
ncbi:MAG: NYN domain-containing protein [Candidatus Omnitrophica bacterium]|nr:NYN domain-containing protein [Candidatus Omnitrophota bacterium]MBU2251464.1 NYN domain-containing protein [Candidatus Omnitrophota bacterium]MBU2265569.1 NYN domain-containing protein [Candidatus Omnitrophota bacterium]